VRHDRRVPSASRTDRASWANAAYDVGWRILHDRERATDAAVHGVQVIAIADPASAILLATRRRALELLAASDDERPAIDDSDGVSFVHDATAATDEISAAEVAWGAAEAMGPSDASLIDLHLRFGVPAGTLADAAGTDPSEADEWIRRLQGRLEGALASWRIFNDGKPRCESLSAILEEEDNPTFGPRTGRHIAKHAVGCETCRSAMVDGGGSGVDDFALAPILRAPAAVHEAVPATVTTSVPDDDPIDTDAPLAEPAVPPQIVRAGSERRTERRMAVPPAEPSTDLDDVGGPGLLAGIVLGIVISVILIAGVTAWVLTSS
jgi:hypothetical protein